MQSRECLFHEHLLTTTIRDFFMAMNVWIKVKAEAAIKKLHAKASVARFSQRLKLLGIR